MNEIITNNYDTSHKALDIVSSDRKETNIIALESGTVETVVNNVKTTNHSSKGLATYGNFVKVKQNNGKTALYAHMKYGSVNVAKGQSIEKGTVIGTIGETGNAYGKHLHLEIQNENNIKENPIISLNEEPKEETIVNTPVTTETNETNNSNNENTNTNSESTNTNSNNNNQSSNTNIQSNNENKEKSPISNNNPTENTSEYLNASNYRYGSIVDALKSIGSDSSYTYRKALAKANGITNYHGTYFQNVKMLRLIKQGKLKKV